MRVALLALNACAGDALGNQLAGKIRFFAERGWELRLFVESLDRLHPEAAPFTHQTDARTLWTDPEQRQFLCESDLVVAEFGVSFSLLHLLPALAAARPRILIEYHGLTPPEQWDPTERWRLAAALEDRPIVWCADRVIVKSRFSERELVAATGLPAERIRRVPCFVDQGPQPARSDACPLGRVLLFVGRLAKNKRAPLLVEAVGRMKAETPPVHAVLIGDSSDAYAHEAERCRALAAELGVADRVQLLGRVSDAKLSDWYRRADLLIMPSIHEGFCLPVIEAMACGLPVVAARAGALPETLGDAGLSFTPEDVDDLVRQVRRVLSPPPLPSPVEGEGRGGGRIAVVAARHGETFAGGAERSLGRIASALRATGHAVEVFTTCAEDEQGLHNTLPEGTTTVDDLPVHRFPADARDVDRYRRLQDRQQQGRLSNEEESVLLQESLNSRRLVDELVRRRTEFAAVIVGPYLHGLTWQVARRLGPLTLLLPCFHNETLARLPTLLGAYREAAGILYHTPEEQHFAEAELGINHPNSAVIGTWLDGDGQPGNAPVAQRGQDLCGSDYVAYCGRYCRQKGFDRLLDWMRHYHLKRPGRPGRPSLVVMGQSDAALPHESWLLDLGFVPETTKRDVLAGARALVLLSNNESLSIAALEAWAAGVPVIASRWCEVLRGQIARSGGGEVVGSCEEFAQALESLWSEPARWRQMGRAGQAYVQRHYACREAFAERISRVLLQRTLPLRSLLRQRGLERAAQFSRPRWEERFAALLEEELASPPTPAVVELRLEAEAPRLRVGVETNGVLIPVRVTNVGQGPAASKGPGAVKLVAVLAGAANQEVPLPALLPPGASQVVVVPVQVPSEPGEYRVEFIMENNAKGRCESQPFTLDVADGPAAEPTSPAALMLQDVRKALAELHDLKLLPDDYQDVTQGFLADWKMRIKRKLLHNFRTAYVDVLSRQQSRFNERVLTALCQLADSLTVLEPSRLVPSPLAGEGQGGGPVAGDDVVVAKLLCRTLRKQRLLERRLARLEQQLEGLTRSCP